MITFWSLELKGQGGAKLCRWRQVSDYEYKQCVTIYQTITYVTSKRRQMNIDELMSVWMDCATADKLPWKFRLSRDHRELTIRDVCKNCGRDRSDVQVIQCNASNAHGYDFASGYINVLGKLPYRTKRLNQMCVHYLTCDTSLRQHLRSVRRGQLDVPRYRPRKDVRSFVLLRRGTVCLIHSKTLL